MTDLAELRRLADPKLTRSKTNSLILLQAELGALLDRLASAEAALLAFTRPYHDIYSLGHDKREARAHFAKWEKPDV